MATKTKQTAKLMINDGIFHPLIPPHPPRCISGMTGKRLEDGMWEYPPVVAVLEAAVLYPIQEYIQRRQSTIAAQVSLRLIYEIYNKAKRRPWMIRVIRC